MGNNKPRNVIRISGEIYKCPENGTTHDYENVRDTWKCPDCDEYIKICVKNTNTGEQATFIRKRADEVKVGELVKPMGGVMTDYNEVLGIDQLKNGKFGFGLKGLGRRYFDPDEFITCRTGGEW
ncbi:hypothetical protein [Pectobacterium versatile]|uniref:hypothetical protein n=1 Tax=Pectobacterium versatile TaxID=2488639 RepID=UPI002B2412A4|nr:hypothetical protein [Pectobacterium versatile]